MKETMFEFVELLRPELWRYERSHSGCELFKKHSTVICYKIETYFDFPPEPILEYFRIPEKRMQWDENFEILKCVKELEMSIQMYYIKMKSNWPMGNRDLLLCFQAIEVDRTYYVCGKSVEH
jgi:hypothetical protein